MEEMTIKAEPREPRGSRAAHAVRQRGLLPAIIYGHKEKPEPVSIPTHEFEIAMAHGLRTLNVLLGGKKKPYLIKAVQYDHLDHDPIHVDLARVDLDERVRVHVGIELRGIPKGVSEGGMLDHHLADLEIECRVTDIPETLHPVVTDLGLGESLCVKDLELPPGVVALAEPDERVASVRAVTEVAEAEPLEEGEEQAPEPERIGRVREEEESEESKG